MRQSVLVSMFAAMWLVQAALWPFPISTFFMYLAVVVGAAAACMALGIPGMLGKRADGSVPWWSFVLFWPWYVTSFTFAWFNRSREPQSTEVLPDWHVGGWPHRSDLWEPWPSVLDMTNELPRRSRSERYLNLPTWDGTAPSLHSVQQGVRFILAERAAGRPVLVHCAAGHGRAVTVMCAALTAAGAFPTWREAFAHVKARRPEARLTDEQQAVLTQWATSR